MKLKDKKLTHSQTISQLNLKLEKAILELNKSKLDLKINKLKNTSQLKKLRHEIAVLKTIIHQKQLSSPKVEKPITKKEK